MTQPGSADPSTLRVTVEPPLADGRPPETYPDETRLWVSTALADALSGCRAHLARMGESGLEGYDRPVRFEPLADSSAFDAAVATTFSYIFGNGERTLGSSDEMAVDWRRKHGPIYEARIPIPVDSGGRAVDPGGYAAPELTCDISEDYLWRRDGVEYTLGLPRLVIEARRAETPASSTVDDAALAVMNTTKVATDDGFYFVRGREVGEEFPHTTEFRWSGGLGGDIGGDRMARLAWEDSLAFGSRAAESDRDLALLLLGLNLALAVQLATGLALWLWDHLGVRERSRRRAP